MYTVLYLSLYTYVKVTGLFPKKHWPPCLLYTGLHTKMYTVEYTGFYTIVYCALFYVAYCTLYCTQTSNWFADLASAGTQTSLPSLHWTTVFKLHCTLYNTLCHTTLHHTVLYTKTFTVLCTILCAHPVFFSKDWKDPLQTTICGTVDYKVPTLFY